MKTFRFAFHNGINVVQDKAILGDGWATVLDNVDLRSGMPRPFKAPVYVTSASNNTTKIFEYRGKFYTSTEYRDYVPDFIDGIERIYFTEYGGTPQQYIEGTLVDLGTITPTSPPVAAETNQIIPGTVTLTATTTGGALPSGRRSYRIAAETRDGIMPPTGKYVVDIPDGTSSNQVLVEWSPVEDAINYHIFTGTEDEEQEVYKVPSTFTSWTDTGAYAASGASASGYEQRNPFTYMYTFEREINGVWDESGPSSPSNTITASTGRRVTFDILNDGFFGQSGVTSITSGITLTPSGSSPATITAWEYDDLMVQVKFTTGSAHGFTTGAPVYFTGTGDTNWDGKTIDVIADNTTNTIFYVRDMPEPDGSATGSCYLASTEVTLAASPATMIANGDVIYATYVGSSDTYCATGATGTSFTIPLLTSAATGAAYCVTGSAYTISTVGDTDWTAIGAATGTTGTTFTATAGGTGTGTCYLAITELKYVPGNGNIRYRNLYRTGDAGGYALVKKVDIWDSYYDDAIPVTSLGGEPDSYYQENGVDVIYSKPPKGLVGLTSHYGMMFAIDGHKVRWTPVGRPNAWPDTDSFCYVFPHKPVALASFAQSLVVLCEDGLWRLDGNRATSLSISKTLAENGCIAPHSVQKTHAGLLYLSKRGVELFDGTYGKCITAERIPSNFFLGASALATDINFWWYPTLLSYNYCDLASEDGIAAIKMNAYPLNNTVPISEIHYAIRSFYWQGKYFLFWSNSSNYEAHTCICIDLQMDGFPVTTLGMKAVDVYVNDLGRPFALFDYINTVTPSLTVSLTDLAADGATQWGYVFYPDYISTFNASVTSGTGPYTYTWSMESGSVSLTGTSSETGDTGSFLATMNNFDKGATGSVLVSVVDSLGTTGSDTHWFVWDEHPS